MCSLFLDTAPTSLSHFEIPLVVGTIWEEHGLDLCPSYALNHLHWFSPVCGRFFGPSVSAWVVLPCGGLGVRQPWKSPRSARGPQALKEEHAWCIPPSLSLSCWSKIQSEMCLVLGHRPCHSGTFSLQPEVRWWKGPKKYCSGNWGPKWQGPTNVLQPLGALQILRVHLVASTWTFQQLNCQHLDLSREVRREVCSAAWSH